MSSLRIRSQVIFVRGALLLPGELVCGSPTAPFAGTLEIILDGDRYAVGPRLNRNAFGAKILLVTGILQLYGREPSHTWVRLDATVEAGATQLVVRGTVDWLAGDEIVLASTDYDYSHEETATLAAVQQVTSSDGQPATRLTLTDALAHRHFAADETHGGRSISMRGEVGLVRPHGTPPLTPHGTPPLDLDAW
jgi:hypothetical protein